MTQEVYAIAARIKKIRANKERLEEEEEALWKRFFELADDLVGTGENFKQVLSDLGIAIAREMHVSAPRLNIDAFRAELTSEEWKSISVQTRVFDQSRLETQLTKGAISVDLVNEHTEYKDPVPHKKFRAATKKELKEAAE